MSRLGRLHQLTVYFQCVWSLTGVLLHVCSHTLELCEDVCMSLQGPSSGNCVLWYSLLQAHWVLPFSVPFAEMFSIVPCCLHLLDRRISQSLVICLSCPARVRFSMSGSGNFFQCVIEGYDNYPFSISTVDMFIILNVHLPVSLLVCIMEIFSIYQWHAL